MPGVILAATSLAAGGLTGLVITLGVVAIPLFIVGVAVAWLAR